MQVRTYTCTSSHTHTHTSMKKVTQKEQKGAKNKKERDKSRRKAEKRKTYSTQPWIPYGEHSKLKILQNIVFLIDLYRDKDPMVNNTVTTAYR